MVMALDGIRVLDLSRLAPGPYCSMLLSDFGADVLLVEATPGASAKLDANQPAADAEQAAAYDALGRGKRSVALNLKDAGARQAFFELVQTADVVIEGFRPGVVKRLGIDYNSLVTINPRIIYCSISGFGQTGPYSNLVGHDINYISIAGALGITARPGEPLAIPTNLIADFAAGGLFAAFAICLAILAREQTGRGQSVDISMTDGVLSLMTLLFSRFFGSGGSMKEAKSMLGGSTPYYNTYETSDGRWFSIGSIEPHFYASLCEALGAPEFADKQLDERSYPAMFEKFAATFRTKTADEWAAIMSERDICGTPVLDMNRAVRDPHNLARGMVVKVESPVGRVTQIGIGPKLSETPGRVRGTAPLLGQHTDEVLRSLGYAPATIAALRERGAVA
jgi:crotonobetainyl-CoA:carnitine CoA-transferase CaiB-like acyl-CoA transferase